MPGGALGCFAAVASFKPWARAQRTRRRGHEGLRQVTAFSAASARRHCSSNGQAR